MDQKAGTVCYRHLCNADKVEAPVPNPGALESERPNVSPSYLNIANRLRTSVISCGGFYGSLYLPEGPR